MLASIRQALHRQVIRRKRLAFDFSRREDPCAGLMFQSGQVVRVNLAGLQAESVMFQAAVTDAVCHIVKETSEQPPKYLVKLLFSFRALPKSTFPQTTSTRTGDRSPHACWNSH